MKFFQAEGLKKIASDIFAACGTPEGEAKLVAAELVEASLMGMDSHGVMRIKWYFDEIQRNRIKPGASIRIEKETPTIAVVDGGYNFGQVVGLRMVEIVSRKAKEANISCAVCRHCHHVGRLGSYVQKLAERNLIGIAFASCVKEGHFVAPWGGREGRLATNPLAYGIPAAGNPMVLDMSTSMISEGKIRFLMHQGKDVPSGCILDAQGQATTDPKAFYGPPKGVIMPFGSELGYKGFGLGILVEAMGRILGGEALSDEYSFLNMVCLIAVDPEAFSGKSVFTSLVEEFSGYLKSATPAPGFDKVLLPGELDFSTREARLKEGIPVPEATWKTIVKTAEKAGVPLPEGIS